MPIRTLPGSPRLLPTTARDPGSGADNSLGTRPDPTLHLLLTRVSIHPSLHPSSIHPSSVLSRHTPESERATGLDRRPCQQRWMWAMWGPCVRGIPGWSRSHHVDRARGSAPNYWQPRSLVFLLREGTQSSCMPCLLPIAGSFPEAGRQAGRPSAV
ncbi:hypothetical protein MPTK1_4g00140 [Marchantia polymorpha subsp. ruderalis]|uniref:Uncharacterized protein n=2 Tax=Marchantia polymorpha TaxID=3197 RepID=A0AAF6B4R9_MARPO|nr:hypothetical protein MARPO_0162s0007 [Marchantia polymorpha]BBN07003.1 hypothetical protein Mp_4g00140 [Marchantia polymorpha subsp. ruderalis]|eukprot:PTQ28474.1 hypothetical protein MARPO_0162s0007 [Marchantia polymorpha]